MNHHKIQVLLHQTTQTFCSWIALIFSVPNPWPPMSFSLHASNTNSNVSESISITPFSQLHYFDIRKLEEVAPNNNQIHSAGQRGHLQHPANFPHDETGRGFPCSLLHTQLNNGEKILRDWLIWSIEKQSKSSNQNHRLPRYKLDITLFLAERGLPFRGVTEKLGDPHNGLFLGICELLPRYDKVLELHLAAVKEAQDSKRRIQVTYPSKETQNKFIECCSNTVLARVLKEVKDSKYYAVVVDATPDTGSLEQNVFVLRYVHCNTEEHYEVQERFLDFVDN